MREEFIKQKYAEALNYCREGKLAEARGLAQELLATEPRPRLCELYAYAILADAEETAVKRLHNLIALQRLGQAPAWIEGRYKNLKSELFDELSGALEARQYKFVENRLDLVGAIVPDDATASMLRKLLQQSLAAHAQTEFQPIAAEPLGATSEQDEATKNADARAAAPSEAPVETAEAAAALDENPGEAESAPTAIMAEAQNTGALEQSSTQAENAAVALAPQEIGEVYPPEKNYSAEELKNIREKYQHEGRQQELPAWFEQRIAQHDYWADYTESALVYEALGEMETAEAQLLRFYTKQKSNPQAERWRKQSAAWRILNFYRRVRRRDLAARFYAEEKDSELDSNFLQELAEFAHPAAPEASAAPQPEAQEVFEKEEGAAAANQATSETRAQEPQATSAPTPPASRAAILGRMGLFIDHENFLQTAYELNLARGITLPFEMKKPGEVYKQPEAERAANDPKLKARWFTAVLRRLLEKARQDFQRVAYRVAAGNWQNFEQAFFLRAYVQHKFAIVQPEGVWERPRNEQERNRQHGMLKANSVDFKLTDEIRRVQQRALAAGAPLRQVVIVSNDGDYAHLAANLLEEEIGVQIWGMNNSVHGAYYNILGRENVVAIDELCLYQA